MHTAGATTVVEAEVTVTVTMTAAMAVATNTLPVAAIATPRAMIAMEVASVAVVAAAAVVTAMTGRHVVHLRRVLATVVMLLHQATSRHHAATAMSVAVAMTRLTKR